MKPDILLHVTAANSKRGKRPHVPRGDYESEQGQLCDQGLVLHQHAYVCEECAIYYVTPSLTFPTIPVTLSETSEGKPLNSSIEVRFVSISTLIRLKQAAGRAQDLDVGIDAKP